MTKWLSLLFPLRFITGKLAEFEILIPKKSLGFIIIIIIIILRLRGRKTNLLDLHSTADRFFVIEQKYHFAASVWKDVFFNAKILAILMLHYALKNIPVSGLITMCLPTRFCLWKFTARAGKRVPSVSCIKALLIVF